MKKMVIKLLFAVVLIGAVCVGYYVGRYGDDSPKNNNNNNNNNTTEKEKLTITAENKEVFEKISKVVFGGKKENLKVEDITESRKASIARALTNYHYTEKTGTEMTEGFRKYFGKNQTVTYDDIPCGMNHGNAEENILLIFDKEKDMYVYNDKHPGHGGGGNTYYGFEMKFDSVDSTDKEYIYNAKIFFYGPAYGSDTGEQWYGSGYKTYNDAINEKNALLKIDDNNDYLINDGPPRLNVDKVFNDFQDQLDTYSFYFEKEDENVIFKKYQKKK